MVNQVVQDAWSSFCGVRVLITGGLGFIGSSLARRLLDLGARITLVDSLIPQYGGCLFNIHGIEDRVHVNIADVRDPYAMAYLVKNADFLFNLAGQTSHLDSMHDPKTDLDINAAAQLSILEACRHNNPEVRVVFASTRQIYGRPEYFPVDERHPIRPVDVNGINKLAGEWYHLLYHEVYGIRTCALRLTNTYGPRMRVKDARQTFLGVWIRNTVQGVEFDVYGDGRQLRDFNYIDDVVEALVSVAVTPAAQGTVYNLGSRKCYSLVDLARIITEIQPEARYRLVPFPADRKAIDIGDYYSDFGRINASIGWEPSVDLGDGLVRTLDYYRQHISEYI